MITKEEFELHKSIIDWMREAGVPFMEAMAILSYAIQTDRSICESYIELGENINNINQRDQEGK